MAIEHRIAWGVAGSATTMLARRMTRRAMHEPGGAPRLPWNERLDNSFAMMLVLAAAAGALLAVGDVLLEQRKRVTRVA